MRILVIDKLASFRKKLRGWLVDGGHSAESLIEAGNGQAAMELLRREEFKVDAIICEWEQTAVGAADLVHQLRAVPGFAHIGFIAIGPATPAQERSAKQAGVTQYMHQPVDPEALLQSLVVIEKATIASRRHDPSATTRFRILASDPPKVPASAAAMGVAEAELRRGAVPVTMKPGETLVLQPGSALHWVLSGSLSVTEARRDGILLEYKLMPGQFLGEAPFGGCPIESISARADGEVRLGSRDAASVDQLRQRHPILFYSFRNIAGERARKFQKAVEKKVVERTLAGEVESLPVGDLFGILHGAKKTGVLRLQSESRTYYIQFVEGIIRHAETEGQVGEEVCYAALALSRGHFEFMAGPAIEGPITIATDTRSLLLEGLKRRGTDA